MGGKKPIDSWNPLFADLHHCFEQLTEVFWSYSVGSINAPPGKVEVENFMAKKGVKGDGGKERNTNKEG